MQLDLRVIYPYDDFARPLRPNGGHQARATELHPTLGNGKLLGVPPSAALAERVACMPGWAAI
jgi:hypothetical protein